MNVGSNMNGVFTRKFFTSKAVTIALDPYCATGQGPSANTCETCASFPTIPFTMSGSAATRYLSSKTFTPLFNI